MARHDEFEVKRWTTNLQELDAEIVRLAAICDVPILAPGAIERILDNDISVAQRNEPKAFEKLRYLLIMHFEEKKKAAAELGPGATAAIVQAIVESLRQRVAGSAGTGKT
jgi:hypothetical protein